MHYRNGVLLTMISEVKIKFIWITVITTDGKLSKPERREGLGYKKLENRNCVHNACVR